MPMAEHTYEKLMARALRLLAARPRSTEELRQKLKEKNPGCEQIIEDIVTRLIELGYLDDAQLAGDYAQLRIELKALGPRRLRNELARRKIADDLIERTLKEVYTPETEEALLARAVEKWLRMRGRPRTRADAKKLFDHLIRLGFDAGRAREKVDQVSEISLHDDQP
jgi:regulatory protein